LACHDLMVEMVMVVCRPRSRRRQDGYWCATPASIYWWCYVVLWPQLRPRFRCRRSGAVRATTASTSSSLITVSKIPLLSTLPMTMYCKITLACSLWYMAWTSEVWSKWSRNCVWQGYYLRMQYPWWR
jgi:hypothetical protein